MTGNRYWKAQINPSAAKQLVGKVAYGVILSEAKNLSGKKSRGEILRRSAPQNDTNLILHSWAK